MKKSFVILSIFIMIWLIQLNFAFAQLSEGFPSASSPSPVGSGARALGMGGAFIGVADDATAASWNPGGLVKLNWPEISVVGDWYHRVEDNKFGNNPEANGAQSVSQYDFNYSSLAYPFRLLNRKMVVSLNYQHLYDFTREWNYSIIMDDFAKDRVDYQQSGSLSALGFAYCIQMIPAKLSLGFTLNLWDDDLFNNEWEKKVNMVTTQKHPIDGTPVTYNKIFNDQYSFSGFNINLGMLWHPTNKLTIGMVFKSPFTADIKHTTLETTNGIIDRDITQNEKLDMPMSYGVGFAYQFSDKFTMSADIYRTEWQDFILKKEDTEESLITGKPVSESDIDPTHQVRIGAEYLFYKPDSKYVISIRGGMFYDPAPVEGNPDDIYGFTLGSGFVIGRYVFDIACEYRFGNDVGTLMVNNYDFSQDLSEFKVYSSLIVHFEN
ncbi:MAG: conjugal transfer protein TraF [Desulfobacterales bacterium]|nr:conjugal transfer protein TraF [Desulfobacterales bacterium]